MRYILFPAEDVVLRGRIGPSEQFPNGRDIEEVCSGSRWFKEVILDNKIWGLKGAESILKAADIEDKLRLAVAFAEKTGNPVVLALSDSGNNSDYDAVVDVVKNNQYVTIFGKQTAKFIRCVLNALSVPPEFYAVQDTAEEPAESELTN